MDVMEEDFKLLKSDTDIQAMEELINGLGADPKYLPFKNIHSYISIVGAIREDVFDYLMETVIFKSESVPYINELIKAFAAPEWLQLIKDAEDKETPPLENRLSIIKVFQQTIIRACRDGIKFDVAKKAYDTSKYPFEMNLKLQNLQQNSLSDLFSLVDELKGIVMKVKEKQDVMQNELPHALGKEDIPVCEENDSCAGADIGKAEDSDVKETKRNEVPITTKEEKQDLSGLVAAIRQENEQLRKEMSLQNESFLSSLRELFGQMVPVEEKKPIKQTGECIPEKDAFLEEMNAELEESIEDTLCDEDISGDMYEDEQIYGNVTLDISEEMPEILPNEDSSVISESFSVAQKDMVIMEKDLVREKKHVVLFQKIRERRRKATFNKLSDNKKMEELFLIMKEKKYTSEMISRVRECLLLNVSYEFIYSFVETDATIEDFDKLIAFRKKESVDTVSFVNEEGIVG